jgi:DmsE family decaheme c-type cytochrome
MKGHRWLPAIALVALAAALPGRASATQDKAAATKAVFDVNDCRSCHEDAVKSVEATLHGAAEQSCANCHGDPSAHVKGAMEGTPGPIQKFKQMSPADSSGVCMTCHNKAGQKHFMGSSHDSRGLACASCHNPHPKGAVPKALLAKPSQVALCTSCHLQKKAQLLRPGHMPIREGKLQCTSCHNPHGTPNDRMLLQTSVNQNCYSCHAEKRGPFLWEHAPVRESCLNCHDAHGSLNEKMLKVKAPLLCQQCHQTSSHPGPAYPAQSRYAFNQACLSCHPSIHGSVHPSGNRFFR